VSRRRSNKLISMVAAASVATMALAAGVSSASAPPDDTGAAAGGVEIGGSACGTPHGPWDQSAEPSGEVRVAWNDPLLSFNNNTIHGNALANDNVLYLMNLGGFIFYNTDVELMNNDAFGTCTLDSLDPLTITYTINEGVTWSDGVPVDAADMLLVWGSLSTHLNDADTVTTDTGLTAEADAEGNPIVVAPDDTELVAVDDPDAYGAAFDPETGALLEGYTFKETAGVAFAGSSEAFQNVTQMPTISEDGRSMTMVYDNFYVDYPYNPPTPDEGGAAHIVASRALGIEDPAEAKAALIDAFANDDREALKSISEFWNTGFDTDELPDDPGLYIGFGPYNVTGYTQRTEMTFEAREDYTWGPKPHVQTLVYRIIGDPVAAAQALENEEIDIIQPQATADLLTQLSALEDRGVVTVPDPEATYEHIDLAVNNGGPFDPAAYGGDEEVARMVRTAFLKTVPRDEIVSRLIEPLNPGAEPRNSFTQDVTFPWYQNMSENNGLVEAYGTLDIEGATALLEEAGVETPIDVRYHYAANNPRRASEYELVRDSAAQAGFNVIDGASPSWGNELPNTGIYDAAMFGWISTSTAVTGSNANFITGGANNYYGYSNERVDELLTELESTADPARQEEILLEVEQNLVDDAFGITLFQFPGVMAYNSTYVDNVVSYPLAPKVFVAFWEWTPVG